MPTSDPTIPATRGGTPLDHVQRLVRKLESIGTLSPDERDAILQLPMHVRELGPGHEVLREGDRPTQCCLVLDGFVCRFKLTEDGGRQIMSFHIAGDIPDLQTLHLSYMDHHLHTVTSCKLAFVQHSDLNGLSDRHPRIARLLWRDTLIDAALFREWMLGIGRRSAYTRIAHLLCELVTKLSVIGLREDATFPVPLTQTDVADALGLTTVHVNRTLKDLRAEKLFTWKARRLTILDWEGLKQAAEFDPAYLHLHNGS